MLNNKITPEKLRNIWLINLFLFICLIITNNFIFFKRSFPIHLLLLSLIILTITLLITYIFYNNSLTDKSQKFKKKLFIYSMVISTISVIILQLYFYTNHGHGFEIYADDSIDYFTNAKLIVRNMELGRSWIYGLFPMIWLEDLGFPMVIAILFYLFTDSIWFVFIMHIFIGSISAVYVYKIGQFTVGEQEGRLASTLFMVFPVFNYYTGVVLKETLMIFMLLVSVYHILLIFSSKNNLSFIKNNIPKSGTIIVMILILMLLFRPINTLLLIVVVLSNFILQRKSLNFRTILLLLVLTAGIFSITKLPLVEDTYRIIENSSTQFETTITHYSNRAEGNKLASSASITLLYPISFIGPLPTMVNIKKQDHFWIHIAGNYLLSTLSIFLIIGLLVSFIKRKNTVLLLLITGYLMIITIGGYSTSVRRIMPIIPFLLIIIPYGMTVFKNNMSTIYLFYCEFIIILIIAWNIFKLAGRNIVI